MLLLATLWLCPAIALALLLTTALLLTVSGAVAARAGVS